jgi:hypothetical protein
LLPQAFRGAPQDLASFDSGKPPHDGRPGDQTIDSLLNIECGAPRDRVDDGIIKRVEDGLLRAAGRPGSFEKHFHNVNPRFTISD